MNYEKELEGLIYIYIYTVNLDKSMLSMLFVTNVLLVKQIYSCF